MKIKIDLNAVAGIATLTGLAGFIVYDVVKARKDEKKRKEEEEQLKKEREEVLDRQDYEPEIYVATFANDKLDVDQRAMAHEYAEELYSEASTASTVAKTVKSLDKLDILLNALKNGSPEEIQAILKVYETKRDNRRRNRELSLAHEREMELVKTNNKAEVEKTRLMSDAMTSAASKLASSVVNSAVKDATNYILYKEVPASENN